MRPLSVFALAALLGCASDPGAQEPIAALYEPPGTLPIRVGLRSDNSLPSQLYGGAVIRDLKLMNLFTEIVHPYNAKARMDVKLRLFVERAETGQLDEFVLGLVDAGTPIRGAFAKPDPIITTRLPVGPDVGSGVMGTLRAYQPGSVRVVARRLANALGQRIYEDREALLDQLSVGAEQPDPE